MKGKALMGIVFAALLIASTFTALSTKAVFKGTITIGIIGPQGLPHWEPAGMKPAAEMTADEINAAGGVHLADGDYQIVLKFGNEYAYPAPDPAAAALEVERLITVEGCEYIIGGFRTECTATMIEKAMDYGVPFFINGAATNELVSTTVNKSDPVKYARYKYLFRVMPTNGTVLLYTIASSLQYLIAAKLLSIYGSKLWPDAPNPQVKVAVVMEDLEWTQKMWFYMTTPGVYPLILGKYANVTYKGRIPDGTADCTPWLQGVKDSGARIMIHIFSGVTGPALIKQWKAMSVNALPVGINVFSQTKEYWTDTEEACEFEAMLITTGTRTPLVPGLTEVFWDKFVSKTGTWPIYTAFGAEVGIRVLVDGLEHVGTKNKEQLVGYYEDPAREIITLTGTSRFDSSHDIYVNDTGYTRKPPYVRANMAQWQAGRLEIVVPVDQPTYSKRWAIPTWMYPLTTDITYDGKTDMKDIGLASKAFGTSPGHVRWQKEADINFDNKVDMKDIGAICKDFGQTITLPLP